MVDDDLDHVLAALADPTRRSVVESLGSGPRRAGELAAAVGVPATSLSRHLQVLRASGVVTADVSADDARVRLYSLRPDSLVALHAWLDQVEAFWSEQLVRFKEHAERTRPRARR
jgi:DNA-binding transcriptional ArsR family regulator